MYEEETDCVDLDNVSLMTYNPLKKLENIKISNNVYKLVSY